jgi:lyso-ornithine lipid O-acyltransferase
MTANAAANDRIVNGTRRARIAVKIAMMIALFIIILPPFWLCHIAARGAGAGNPCGPWFMRGIARIAGIELRVTGDRVTGGEFLLANHVSWMDIVAISAASGAAFVGHDGLGSIPFIRWLCSLNGTVLVARHDRTKIKQQIEDVRAAIGRGGALAIFPEGTTGNGTDLLPFKSSLLSALHPLPQGIAVQPVLLDYGSKAADIAWIGDEHGVDNFKRVLARREPVLVNVHFLPPLPLSALADRKSIAACAEQAIKAELQKRQRVAL